MSADVPDPVDRARTLRVNEWLEQPEVQIARALRGLSWPTALEIFEALGLKPTEYETYEVALREVVRSGNVTRKRGEGLDRYNLLLDLEPPAPGARLPNPPRAPGTHEGEERGGWFWWRGSWRPL